MEILNIETLKKIVENIPDDFDVVYNDRKSNHNISDKIEVDAGKK